MFGGDGADGANPFGAPRARAFGTSARDASASPFGASDPFGRGDASATTATTAPGGAPGAGGGTATPFGGFGGGAPAANAPGGVGGASGGFGGFGASASASPFGSGTGAAAHGASGGGGSAFGGGANAFGGGGAFGASAPAASASPFGAPASPFGTGAPAASASPFGASASPFGASASPFGASASPFGASAPQTAPSTPFAPVASSPFGGGPSSTTAPVFGAFGAASPSSTPSPFAVKVPEPSAAASPFGGGGFSFSASPTTAPASPFGASPFGAAPAVSSAPTGGIFGVAPTTGGLSATASPFAPKPATSGFAFGGANPPEAEKRDAIASIPAFGGGAKAFVPPKPKPIADRLNLASEAPSTSYAAGDETGEITTSSGHIVGTCDLMCPSKEREFRSANGDLEVFERVDPEDRMKSHPDLCIKKYTRIVDEITPDMVRTKKGLQLAIDQLWRILDAEDKDFMTKSKFLWDRLRSIRQDLNLQQITDSFAVKLLEQMVRYTILAEHELCEATASATNPDGHNSHLNVEQLTKTLTSLRHMYDDHADRGQQLGIDAEAEMFCYQLLLRIDSHGRYAVQRSEMLNDLRSVRAEVLKHRDVQFALQCHRAYHENNVARFFHLVKKATYVQACCLHKFFNSMRGKALEVMNTTYGKFIMPITEIARLLHTDDMETEALCIHHGLNVTRGKAGDKPPAVTMRESSYISPAEEFPISRSDLIMNKRAASYLLEIVGKDESVRIAAKTLPTMSTPKTTPQLSEADKRKQQADELRAKIALRESQLEKERAAILAKKKEIEERKAAEKKAAEEAERKAKEAEEAARRAEEEAKAAEAKARAEAEAAEAERRRLAEEAARAKAEAEAKALAEAERRKAEEEAERQRVLAEERARETAAAAHRAAIAKAEAEARARRAAEAEAERLRLIAEENARRQAAEAKAARKRAKRHMAIRRLTFSLWRMNSKEFKRERLIGEALAMASPAPALNLGGKALLDASAASERPTDALAQLRKKIESVRSPEFGVPLDVPQTVGLALHEAAATAAPSALVWKCLICTGAEADSGASASSRPRTTTATIVAEWLRTKLSRGGSAHATEPGTGTILSLYGARLPLPGTDEENDYMMGPLAWIVVRDVPAMMENSKGSNAGASSAIFVLDCGGGTCESHELKRLRAFSSAVKRSEAPLVIFVASRDNTNQNDIKKSITSSGIEGALVIFLPPKGPEEWSDDKLSEVLVWTAERAPKAPRRRIAYLSAEIEEALRPGYVNLTVKPRVSPRACIRAFNDALDQLEHKILEAAQTEDGAEWPPVEIGLVNAALPPPGWRSKSRRTKVLDLLHSVRLPDFEAGEKPVRAFIDYVAAVLPHYPKDYGQCLLAQARYDPHFHKLQDIPWVTLFQTLITLLLSGLESQSRDACIYLPPGHPSYDFTPYEPEPELLAERASSKTPTEAFDDATNRKRKHEALATAIPEASRFEEIDSAPLDNVRAVLDDLRRDVDAHARFADASERWLAALATNTPGTAEDPESFADAGESDAHLTAFNASVAAERAAEARLRLLLDAAP